MSHTRGYSSYRGKKSAGRIALIVLLLLVLLAACTYLILQNFVVYDSDGSIHLDLPFFQKEDGGAGEEDEVLELPPVEIITGETEDPQKETVPPLRYESISVGDVCRTEEDPLNRLLQAGNTGVVVEVKSDNGFFHYTSPQAHRQAVADDAVSNTLLSAAIAGDVHTAARLSCFHDSFHAFSDMAGSGICQASGYIWYDNLSSYWIDPSKEAARAYLIAVASECVEMGFDELILTEFGYPTKGNLSQIDYSGLGMSKEDALELFLSELRESVGEEIVISVEVSEETVLAGGDSAAGIDLARLAVSVDRICVAASDRAAVEEAFSALDSSAELVWKEGETYLFAGR